MSLLQYLVIFLYAAIVVAILCGLVFAGYLLIRKAIKTFKEFFERVKSWKLVKRK